MKILVVTNMYPTPEQPAFGTFVYSQVESLRQAGLEVDVLFINGRKNSLNYLWGLFRLWGRLLKERPDVSHAHYVFSGIIARLQPFWPVVVTYHGSELGVPGSRLEKLSRMVYPFFERVIVVSPQMKRTINNPPRTQVIPCGINFDEIRPIPLTEARRRLGLPPESPLVIWAGEQWRPEKRYYILEQAVELLKQDLPEVELVLVSGQPHQVVPIYMSACDVLALTSSHEGSPMVIKEAMACNLPIVSVDVGDVAEVIAGTEHCHLVEPTPEAVADKLRVVLSNRQRTNGRSRIDHLRSDRIAGQIIDLYQELCRPQGRGNSAEDLRGGAAHL